MGKLFLPIVSENILFYPFSTFIFYCLAWFTSLLVTYPKVFLSKPLMYVIFFALLYFILVGAGLFNVGFEWIIDELKPLFLASLLLQYFLISRDFRGLKILLTITILFISITILTTIIGLHNYPSAVRDLTGILSKLAFYSRISFYQSRGIAPTGFIYGLAFTIPVFISLIRMRDIHNGLKFITLALVCLSIYAIYMAQLATPFLVAIIGLGFSAWTKEKISPALIRVSLIMTVVIIMPKHLIGDIILSLTQFMQSDFIKERLVSLAITLKQGLGVARTQLDYRYDRIPILLNQFYQSPIIGGGKSLEHNYWVDRLAMFGLVGVFPWVLIIKSQIQDNLKFIEENDKVYYLIIMVVYVAVGFIRNIGQNELSIFIFFIIPAMLIVKGKMAEIEI